MIKVDGLTKRYARHVAVNNVSFEVTKGEIVGFLGPNGAGKTTTMRVLTCFLPPTEGRAEVAGFDVMEQPLEVKRRIGYLPETPPLYPEMEVSEYLHFVGRLKGIPSGELSRRVDEVAERCAVADVKLKLIAKLSKGYRQRVGLAQAIIHNPEVLVLDEPTAGLDPKQINETRELIHKLSGDHTIILSTHILPEVEHTCQKVIIINRGQIVATDSVANLKSRLQGAEMISISFQADSVSESDARHKLEQVPGVSRVVHKESRNSLHLFDVESQQGQSARADIARAVVHSGWNLHELRTSGVSLEEIFLQLTGGEKHPVAEEVSK
ncbi:MAG: ABC transporter ATP-binding protein [Bryobacteraceae bacterium]